MSVGHVSDSLRFSVEISPFLRLLPLQIPFFVHKQCNTVQHHKLNEINLPFEVVNRIKILGTVFGNKNTAMNTEESWVGRTEKIINMIQQRSSGKDCHSKMLFGESVNLYYAFTRKCCLILMFYKFVWQDIFK